jgi:hypothetical protein
MYFIITMQWLYSVCSTHKFILGVFLTYSSYSPTSKHCVITLNVDVWKRVGQMFACDRGFVCGLDIDACRCLFIICLCPVDSVVKHQLLFIEDFCSSHIRLQN